MFPGLMLLARGWFRVEFRRVWRAFLRKERRGGLPQVKFEDES